MIKNFIKLTFLLLVSLFVINSSSNVYIDRSVSIEHCNQNNTENYEIQNSNLRLPEDINIHVNNNVKNRVIELCSKYPIYKEAY